MSKNLEAILANARADADRAHRMHDEASEEVDRLRAELRRVRRLTPILDAIRQHYIKCRLSHPTNEDWFACEARAVAAALTPQEGGNGGAVKRDAGGPAPGHGEPS